MSGGNVLLYENNNFDRYAHKISAAKVAKFSIAPGNAPYHIICYMPGIYIYFHITFIQYFFIIILKYELKIYILNKIFSKM